MHKSWIREESYSRAHQYTGTVLFFTEQPKKQGDWETSFAAAQTAMKWHCIVYVYGFLRENMVTLWNP